MERNKLTYLIKQKQHRSKLNSVFNRDFSVKTYTLKCDQKR